MLYKTRAIVLSSRDIKEADSLLTLYSEDRGKMRAVAKGVRKTRSKFGSSLEPFTLARLLLYRKGKPPASFSPREHSSIDIITDAEIERSFRKLRESLTGFACGNYYAELVAEMAGEGESNPAIFYLLCEFFRLIDVTGNLPVLIFSFTLRLLCILGYYPEFNECVGCRMELKNISVKNFFFSTELGGILCQHCRGKDSGAMAIQYPTLKYLKQLLKMEPARLKNLKLLKKSKLEIERLILDYLFYYLEKELKTVEFLRQTNIL